MQGTGLPLSARAQAGNHPVWAPVRRERLPKQALLKPNTQDGDSARRLSVAGAVGPVLLGTGPSQYPARRSQLRAGAKAGQAAESRALSLIR